MNKTGRRQELVTITIAYAFCNILPSLSSVQKCQMKMNQDTGVYGFER